MKTWIAVGLAISGVAAAIFAYTVASANHAFDGCRVVIESEASSEVGWTVRYHSDVRHGTVPLGGDPVVVKLCTFAPRNDPTARFESDRGNLTLSLDPYCSDPRIIVNDTSARLDARLCE